MLLGAKGDWSQQFKDSEQYRNPATVENFINEISALNEHGSNDPRDQGVAESVEQIAERMLKS